MCICEMLYYNWLYMWSSPAVFQTVLLKYHWDTIIVLIEIIYYNSYYFIIHFYKAFQFSLWFLCFVLFLQFYVHYQSKDFEL